MRLTLRTLLAYLDDRLSPANAREIGQKIVNSPFATDLVERIKEVKRRRRLAAPGKPQPMIEANLIAEYLDDQLTPDLVARVEREILASDAMLAEVAAAHEILGLLRDPVSVEPRLRDRLLGLDPTGNTDVIRAVGGEMLPGRAPGDKPPQWKPLTPPTSNSRRLPIIAAAILGLVWIAVVASDSTLFGLRSHSDATRQQNAEVPPAPAVPIVDKEALVKAQTPPDAASEENPKEPAVADMKISVVPGQEEARPAADNTTDTDPTSPATPTENSDTVAQTEPPLSLATELPGSAEASDSRPMPEGEPASPEAAGGVDIATVPRPPEPPIPGDQNPALLPGAGQAAPEQAVAYYLDGDSRSVLLLDVQENLWSTLFQQAVADSLEPTLKAVNISPIIGTSWIGIPGQFSHSLSSDVGGWSVNLLGPCLAQLDRAAPGGLNLLHGRLKLSANANGPWDDARKPTFRLGTGPATSMLTLQTPESRVAIAAVPTATTLNVHDIPDNASVQVLPLDADLLLTVTVLEGSVGLQMPGSEEVTVIGPGNQATWMILDMQQLTSFEAGSASPLTSAPGWLFEKESADVPEVARQKTRLLDVLAKPGEPGDSVLTLLDDRNSQIGVLAVSVISAVRDSDRLLSILFEARDETVHRAAIDGLSSIANSSMLARESIRKGLGTRLPPQETEPMMQLLLGLNEAQASDPAIGGDLLAMLSNERLATRTVSIYRMEQVVNDRKGFHPESEASRRREAVRRWQRYFEQNSGRLLP